MPFDSEHPHISSSRCKSYDWFDSYRDTKESIPPKIHEAKGLAMSISVFVNVDLAKDKENRRSQTVVFIFLNKSPIHWYGKRQPQVESSTFGSAFRAMKTGVKMTEDLRYKLRMFGVPIEWPTSLFCDDQAVY